MASFSLAVLLGNASVFYDRMCGSSCSGTHAHDLIVLVRTLASHKKPQSEEASESSQDQIVGEAAEDSRTLP